MTTLAEISATYVWWRECIRRLKLCGGEETKRQCERMTAEAQKQLVMTQAFYLGENQNQGGIDHERRDDRR